MLVAVSKTIPPYLQVQFITRTGLHALTGLSLSYSFLAPVKTLRWLFKTVRSLVAMQAEAGRPPGVCRSEYSLNLGLWAPASCLFPLERVPQGHGLEDAVSTTQGLSRLWVLVFLMTSGPLSCRLPPLPFPFRCLK